MIQFFLSRKVLVTLITIFIVAAGVAVLTQIKRATYPDVEFDVLKITTTYPGASAEDVEINVTKKIEDKIKTVRGYEKIRSRSIDNLSIIYVWVDPNAQRPDRVKDDIRRAVDRVTDLPDEIRDKPLIDELKSSNVPVIEVAVSGSVPEAVLRKIAGDLEAAINEIEGVGLVEMKGYRKREVKILLDADRISQNYVSLNEIIAAVKNRNIRRAGGSLESDTNEKKIVTFSEFKDVLDVRDVIIRRNFDGNQIKLSELARIEDSFEDYDVIPRTNGQPSINLLIRSQTNADIIDISDAIKGLIEKTRPTLPEGANIHIVVDYSHYTRNLLSMVRDNAVLGFVLVLVVLFATLDRFIAFWTAAGVPLSFLGALIFFPVFGININFISLVTLVLVLGMLVDDAIVVAENISRHREAGKSPREAALLGMKEVAGPVTATIVTTIVAFMSLYFMTGVTGRFVWQIPVVVTLTLTVSLLEALFLLPSHIVNSPLKPVRMNPLFERFKNLYQRIIHAVIRHRVKTLLLFTLFFAVAFYLAFGVMKVTLFPYTDVDIFYVVAELPEGTSLKETSNRMKEVERIVKTIPRTAMENYTTTIGHHDRDVYGVTMGLRHNWALVTIFLKPAAERDLTSEEIMADLEAKLNGITGFEKLWLDKFNDGPPVGRPITITIVSNDDEKRAAYSREALTFLSHIKGVKNLEIDEKKGKEALLLKPDYGMMARLGITARDLAETIRAAYSGVVVTSITREGDEIDYRVQLRPDQRRRLSVLENLEVLNNQGRLIPIKNFAALVPSRGYESIKHYNGRRAITITGDVDTKLVTATQVKKRFVKKFKKRIDAEPGMRLIFGGEEKATQESMQSFGIAVVFCVIAIYFILVVLFDSFFKPLIIAAIIPFGLAGAVYTFFAWGFPVSFLGMIGTLGLLGVMVNDAIVMVKHLNDLRKEHGRLSLKTLIEGCRARLRPVVLTTVTTVAGLLPTIFGFGRYLHFGGYEPFIVPLVLALAGGLVFATPITLLLVPVLYSFGLPKRLTR